MKHIDDEINVAGQEESSPRERGGPAGREFVDYTDGLSPREWR